MMEKTFADRLREVIGDEDPTPWATARGISGATIHEWLKKGTAPYPKSMLKLVAGTGKSKSWWLTGQDEAGKGDAAYSLPESAEPLQSGDVGATRLKLERQPEPRDTFAKIPFYDVRASAGHGAFIADQGAARHYAFDRAWLAAQVGIPAHRLALIPVSGTSMEPDLHDGDLVMIDRGDVEVLREGVYVFELDDRLYVKRLSLHGDRLVVASSNGDYPPTELSTLQERAGFRIHGRVLGSPSFKRL
jgi:phage repressor protein C with HTH and peptisase S24 domain